VEHVFPFPLSVSAQGETESPLSETLAVEDLRAGPGISVAVDPREDSKFHSELDLLTEGKLSWEQFLRRYPMHSHLFSRLASTGESHSILHLAVLLNRADLAETVAKDEPHLKLRRNACGLTPLELARLLPREKIVSILHPSPVIAFCDQLNVFFEDRERFEALHDLPYLSQPLFESEKVLGEVMHLAQKAKAEDAIPPERIWMGIYFDYELLVGIHPKVSIRFIDDEVGFGVFAAQRISPCALAGEYTGQLIESKKRALKTKFHCIRYNIWEMGKRKFVLDAEKMGNFTRFINHSSKPNLGLQSVYWRGIPRMIFVALKEIPEGAQLTFDYGAIFWKEHHQRPKLF